MTPNDFITRWQASGAAERANYQLFLSELCDLLDVERPFPKTPLEDENAYVFEKSVPLPHGTTGAIDLYKRGHFVLEAKQGSDKATVGVTLSAESHRRKKKAKKGHGVRGTGGWDTALEKAKRQGERYIRNLPAAELADNRRPPILIVTDVGNTIDLYAEFSGTGGNYTQFPDAQSYRITLDELRDAETRHFLRAVWTNPHALDPAERSAKVTRDIADRLAQLAKSLEGQHEPEKVAQFLMRALFTMFAEDVGLLPERSFAFLLEDMQQNPASFAPMMQHLWETMNAGGFSVILRTQVLRFNGGLFESCEALPLDAEQIALLAEAARADWRDVEPAIFGTLLERALDPIERHKLGAHYTPRAYVERLVRPTVIDPLRDQWEGVQTAAGILLEADETDAAIAQLDDFLRQLATTRILDPACGTGNFLYVTLEQMKRLEGEVLDMRQKLGGGQMAFEIESVRVTPQQFLGIEVNPRAAAIAELVLWIGYLQWHYRTYGKVQPPEPVLKAYHNIECRDAVLAWDAVEPLLDEQGRAVTRWDGRTMKVHPVTGKEVPDETAQLPAYRYLNPRPAEWPAADYIVGNPPFIGASAMRDALGDGYTEAIRATYKEVSNSSDYVMYWWEKSAELLRADHINRFGLITTNSIRQTFNRRVLQRHMSAKNPLSLVFAIPDHPWVDSADGAAVRIAMTVAKNGEGEGVLNRVTTENEGEQYVQLVRRNGLILPDLTIGANISIAQPLNANAKISNRGFELGGAGFIVTKEEARDLGLGAVNNIDKHILDYRNGRDITQLSRNVMVIDMYGLSESEVRSQFPAIYQRLLHRVKPEREQNRNKKLRDYWWLHRRSRVELRDMLQATNRYIATVETAKHRFFVFLDKTVAPDNMLVNIALDDAYFLGILSSKAHVLWALASGGRLGVGNDPRYNKTRCFETFPFPDATEEQKATIRNIAEELDAHRKRQQAQHPKLTLTDMYNVLAKLHAGDSLTAKEQKTHTHGLVSVLKQLHDELDAAVFAAYGWASAGSADELSDEEILEKLVALNAERAAEEANGFVRWLRPDYQAPEEVASQTQLIAVADAPIPVTPVEKQAWPSTLAAQAQAVRAALVALAAPASVRDVAGVFKGSKTKKRLATIGELLEMLGALGQVVEMDEKFALL